MSAEFDHILEHAILTGHAPPDGISMFFGGVYLKRFDIPAGSLLISHKHSYGHPSILASGEAILQTADGKARLVGPVAVTIAAGVQHSLTAITDVVWFCIHAADVAEKAYQDQDPHAMDGLIIVKE